MPRNKSELRELFFKGLVIEFHMQYNSVMFKIPHLDHWFSKQDEQNASINSIIRYNSRNPTKLLRDPQFSGILRKIFETKSFRSECRHRTS